MAIQQQRAFSLIEVMIVVTILAITAVLVLPTFGGSDANRLRAAATVLVADLEFAQMRSMANPTTPLSLVVRADGSGYFIAETATPDTPITDPITKSDYAASFGVGTLQSVQGVTLSSSTIGADRALGYRSRGELDQATAATFTLSSGDREIEIQIEPYTGEPIIGEIQAR